MTRFPCRAVAADPELTGVRVACDLIGGSLADAGRHLAVAADALPSAPVGRRGRLQVLLSVLRLFLARRLNDFPVVVDEAQRLLALLKTAEAAQLGLGEDLRAATFISLGIAEIWALQFEAAERHLTQGIDLARQIVRPYLELYGLAHGAHWMLLIRPGASPSQWSRQAIDLAERHGWGEESLAGMAYAQLGIALLHQGTAGRGRAVAGARRAHPAQRRGTGGRDEPARCARSWNSPGAGIRRRWRRSPAARSWPRRWSHRTPA